MSLHREAPLGIKIMLVGIFIIGILVFGFVVMDAGWTRLMIRPDPVVRLPFERSGSPTGASSSLSPLGTQLSPVPQTPSANAPSGGSTASPPPAQPAPAGQAASAQPAPTPAAPTGNLLDSVRKSIVLVKSEQCHSGAAPGHGTGFVVKSGYVATNAHVVNNCRKITLIDFQGRSLRAKVRGAGESGSAQDLAILSYNDDRDPLPALPLTTPEEGKAGDKIQTIGYPLVAVESGQNAPSPSNEGVIASYDINDRVYYSQGMNINPGNSGGPVFLLSDRKVVGVAMAKSINMQVAEGVGVCIPSAVLREFFRRSIGESLP